MILAGDFNIDFSRKHAHDVYFKDFSIRTGFMDAFDLPNTDIGYTYHGPASWAV